MKIISRYVLSELLQVFLVALSALTLFMIVFGLVKEAQQQGLGLVQIARLVPYVLPEAMRVAVPLTMLFAVNSVFGRMSAANEITALKAAGISPMATIWPALALAMVVSFVSVWLNDVAVSWGRAGVRRVVVNSVEEIIYGRLKQHRSYSTPQLSINVKGVEGRTLIRPTLSFSSGSAKTPTTVSAAAAEITTDAEATELIVTFRNGTYHMGEMNASFPGEMDYKVPLEAVSKKSVGAVSPSDIAMADFPSARAETRKTIDQLRQVAVGKTALALLSGHMEMTVPSATAGELDQVKAHESRMTRLVMEPWRRWANGFSCLCFVLVGAPMAIRMRNADFLTSFFLCFLPILVVYYPIFMMGISRVKSGAFPSPAVWAGNVLITLWGLWLLRRVVRQ